MREQHMRMKEKIVLRVIARSVLPFILLFALYVQFHGDYGPGGGFQAGVIFSAGFILYGLIFGRQIIFIMRDGKFHVHVQAFSLGEFEREIRPVTTFGGLLLVVFAFKHAQ